MKQRVSGRVSGAWPSAHGTNTTQQEKLSQADTAASVSLTDTIYQKKKKCVGVYSLVPLMGSLDAGGLLLGNYM